MSSIKLEKNHCICIFLKCYIDWTLVAEKKRCNGDLKQLGRVPTIEKCANGCRNISSVFAYGTNDYGYPIGCRKNRGCICICQKYTIGGNCVSEKDARGYRLYRIENVNTGLYQSE